MERLCQLTLEEGTSWLVNKPVERTSNGRALLCGVYIKWRSKRLSTFLNRGLRCAYCGRRATYWAIEKHKHQTVWHLNLYIADKDGDIIMTSDHVIPTCKGGSNKLKNRRPACYRCNQTKADHVPNEGWKPSCQRKYIPSRDRFERIPEAA